MTADYSVSCTSERYSFAFWWAVAMVFVYPLGTQARRRHASYDALFGCSNAISFKYQQFYCDMTLIFLMLLCCLSQEFHFCILSCFTHQKTRSAPKQYRKQQPTTYAKITFQDVGTYSFSLFDNTCKHVADAVVCRYWTVVDTMYRLSVTVR